MRLGSTPSKKIAIFQTCSTNHSQESDNLPYHPFTSHPQIVAASERKSYKQMWSPARVHLHANTEGRSNNHWQKFFLFVNVVGLYSRFFGVISSICDHYTRSHASNIGGRCSLTTSSCRVPLSPPGVTFSCGHVLQLFALYQPFLLYRYLHCLHLQLWTIQSSIDL